MTSAGSLPEDEKRKLDRSLLEAPRLPGRGAPRPPLACALGRGCQSCGGKGYVVAAAGEYARASICKCVRDCVACLGRACREEPTGVRPCRTPHIGAVVGLLNAAHIPARYAEATFEGFCAHPGRDADAVRRLDEWRRRFQPLKGKGLLVTGPVGVGKTYLLAALTRELAERGLSVRFTDFFQLLFDLRAGFSEGKSDSTLLGPLSEVDVLVIDELGKGRNRDYDKMVLDQLISTRYAQMKTVITSTNYRLDDLTPSVRAHIPLEQEVQSNEFESADQYGYLESRVGRRIFSRLREMTVFVKLDGDDYRRKDIS